MPPTIPTLTAATGSRIGSRSASPSLSIHRAARLAATNAPVMAAVRVPPSAWSTSQSSVTVCCPMSRMSVTERIARPMSLWISCVRPRAPVRSRFVRVWVALGSIAYSAVTQPEPLRSRHAGTPSTTEAAQRIRVSPVDMRHEPSAYGDTPSSIATGRASSGLRPSARLLIPLPPVCE